MALKTKTVKIEDHVFMINQLNVSEGIQFFRKITDILKDGMAPLASLLSGTADDAAIGSLLHTIALSLSEVEIETIFKNIITKSVFMGGQPINAEVYETHFAGEYHVLLNLILEILKHNYESVLKVGATKVEEMNG